MSNSQWHKLYTVTVEASPAVVFEPEEGGQKRTRVGRELVLDDAMPLVFRPLRPLIVRAFDHENERTLAALKAYAETRRDG